MTSKYIATLLKQVNILKSFFPMQHGIKKYKTGDYYSVQAVSMFTTNQFILLCPKDIIKFYRESWKFELLNVDFDINTRKKLQEEAAYCVPISAISVKRWDMPLQGSKPSS